MVRVAQNLKRKAADKARHATAPSNPFLPPEPEMTVADITPSHLAVLNKFNVVENHLLIVTRDFEHQERLLTLEDFEALWICLREYPSLGFYNGGAEAGAKRRGIASPGAVTLPSLLVCASGRSGRKPVNCRHADPTPLYADAEISGNR